MRPRPAPSAVISIIVLLAACGGTASPSSNAANASSSPPTASSPPSAESSTVVCPNPHGGACLGELDAGTYTTQVFETPLTYATPQGWKNYEDLPGNFLLVPPTASLAGVDAGTADYVSVLDGVAVASADCFESRQAGVDTTPEAMAAWFVEHEGLDATEPVTVEVGGLEGTVVDLRIAPSYPMDARTRGTRAFPWCQ